jgi:hypothetical protein
MQLHNSWRWLASADALCAREHARTTRKQQKITVGNEHRAVWIHPGGQQGSESATQSWLREVATWHEDWCELVEAQKRGKTPTAGVHRFLTSSSHVIIVVVHLVRLRHPASFPLPSFAPFHPLPFPQTNGFCSLFETAVFLLRCWPVQLRRSMARGLELGVPRGFLGASFTKW